MTIIIAIPGVGIWTDSLSMDGRQKSFTDKGFIFAGHAYAYTGSLAAGMALKNWVVNDGMMPDLYPVNYAGADSDTTLVCVSLRSRTVETYEGCPFPCVLAPANGYHICFGSGAMAALGAMAAGASPADAVRICGELETGCGGMPQIYRVGTEE